MKELIKLARTIYPENATNKYIEKSEEYKKAIQALSQSEWISVEDRLPEDWELVLVWSELLGRCIVNSYHEHTEQDSEWFKRNFTHWMPLPQPPQTK